MVCRRCRLDKRFEPKFLVDNRVTRRKTRDMSKGWTLVVCFSRPWCVRPFFADFERLLFDRSKCHLIIYNNTNDIILDKMLLERAKRYQQWHKQKYGERRLHPPFASVRLYKSFRKWGGIIFGQEATFDASKLPTILDMQRDIKNMITTKYFFMLEDDTLFPPDAVKRLFKILKKSKKIGLVSGVESTRSPRLTDKVRLGAYKLLRPERKILERISLEPTLRNVHQVDAVGFYCFAARTDAWLKAFKIFEEDFEIQKTAEPNWAIDTLLTNDVQRAGYKVLVDFETACLHMQVLGNRIYNWAIDRAVPKIDIYIEKYNCYAQGVDLPWQPKKK